MRPVNLILILPLALLALAKPPVRLRLPPEPISPAPLGSPAGWSATTLEAATGDDNKKALAKGKAATFTGEVIDYSCYLQMGKSGEKHRECGRKCILAGQPAGLLLANGAIVLLMAEEHHPRRDGQVSLKEFLAAHAGQQVIATGMMRENRSVRALFVQTMNPVAIPTSGANMAPPPEQK